MAPRLPTLADVLAARRRLEGVALRTPLESAPWLAAETGPTEIRLKLEALQPTGSFKLRGAENKVATLAEQQLAPRLVTASTGNHGVGLAAAAGRHGLELTILVASSVSPAKLERLRALETDRCTVEIVGHDPYEAEVEARRREQAGLATYVSAYNDPEVVAGQATIGLEILEDWPECDAMVVPVGGGGLISGIGLWAKAVKPDLRLVGVQPEASPPIYAYLESGSARPMPIAPTLADGVAGNIEKGSITLRMCRQLVDDCVLVNEEGIADAVRWAIDEPHLLLEGAAVLGIAALRSGRLRSLVGRRVAVVLTGRSVDRRVLASILPPSVGNASNQREEP